MFKNLANVAKRCFNAVKRGSTRLLLGGSLMLTAGAASAAVPPAVLTAVTDSLADVATIGAAILGVIVAIVAFGWLRRIVK